MLVAHKLPVLVDTFHFHGILSVVGILIIQSGIFETQGLGLVVCQGNLCQFGDGGRNGRFLVVGRHIFAVAPYSSQGNVEMRIDGAYLFRIKRNHAVDGSEIQLSVGLLTGGGEVELVNRQSVGCGITVDIFRLWIDAAEPASGSYPDVVHFIFYDAFNGIRAQLLFAVRSDDASVAV